MKPYSRRTSTERRTDRRKSSGLPPGALRPVLASYGAPLLERSLKAGGKRMSLEAVLVGGLQAARQDGVLFRSLAVLVAKNQHRLNFSKLIKLAKSQGVGRELGVLLELTGKLLDSSWLVRQARGVGLPRANRPVRTLLIRNAYERQLAEARATEITRRWKVAMNVSEESLGELLRKHYPEAVVV